MIGHLIYGIMVTVCRSWLIMIGTRLHYLSKVASLRSVQIIQSPDGAPKVRTHRDFCGKHTPFIQQRNSVGDGSTGRSTPSGSRPGRDETLNNQVKREYRNARDCQRLRDAARVIPDQLLILLVATQRRRLCRLLLLIEEKSERI